MYDDAVFGDRFRYQSTIPRFPVCVKLSRLLHAHIAYETDTAKIIAAFCRITYCFARFDTVEFNRTRVQTTRWTMMWFSLMISILIDYV